MEQNHTKLVMDAIDGIREYVKIEHGGVIESAKRALGMEGSLLNKWIKEERKPSLSKIGPILEKLGARIVFPSKGTGQTLTREVCFVDAKIVHSGQNAPPPTPEPYIAVPLVGEAGAGPGIVSEERFKSWVLVYKHLKSISKRHDFLAVEIGKNSRSMIPLLHPGDIVLVDLEDKGVDSGFRPPGNIFLVREPGQEGGGKVKRVSLTQEKDETILTYYSENIQEHEPESYLLSKYFDGETGKAIVGKVVWAWTDLSRK